MLDILYDVTISKKKNPKGMYAQYYKAVEDWIPSEHKNIAFKMDIDVKAKRLASSLARYRKEYRKPIRIFVRGAMVIVERCKNEE